MVSFEQRVKKKNESKSNWLCLAAFGGSGSGQWPPHTVAAIHGTPGLAPDTEISDYHSKVGQTDVFISQYISLMFTLNCSPLNA